MTDGQRLSVLKSLDRAEQVVLLVREGIITRDEARKLLDFT